ncbi:hypothetical protein FCV25MIE_11646, partial [Fagus crenata]
DRHDTEPSGKSITNLMIAASQTQWVALPQPTIPISALLQSSSRNTMVWKRQS